MARHALPLLIGLVVALLLVLTPSPMSAAAAQDVAQDNPYGTFDLSFRGGPVVEYVDRLRKVTTNANVVLLSGVELINVPAVTLQSVDLNGAVKLLQDIETEVEGRPVQVLVREHSGRGGSPVYTLSARSRRAQAAEPVMSQVWSIATLTAQNVPAAEALTAVETALDLLDGTDGAPAAQLRFHEATSLIIARGTAEQLSAIDSVVVALHRTAEAHNRGAQNQAEAELMRMIQQTQQLQDMLAHSEAKREDAQDRAVENEGRAVILQREMKTMEVEIDEVRQRNLQLMREINDLRAALENAKRGGQ